MKINIILNRLLHFVELTYIPTIGKNIYLTFDDGPEEDITNFILDELEKYSYKATFFCCGQNVEKYPKLVEKIAKSNHAIANHTYSHSLGFSTKTADYVKDVIMGKEVISIVSKKNCHYFRPPGGEITLIQYLKLFFHNKIVYWSIVSDDHRKIIDFDLCFDNLVNKTRRGSIVLFHFSKEHEKGTKLLLPAYLKWLHTNGFSSKAI